MATLQLAGTYSGATFTIGSDGKGGANVTLLTAARSNASRGQTDSVVWPIDESPALTARR